MKYLPTQREVNQVWLEQMITDIRQELCGEFCEGPHSEDLESRGRLHLRELNSETGGEHPQASI